MNDAPRQRALFFAPTLETGGAERVIVEYVNHAKSLEPALALQYVRGPLLDEVASGVAVFRIEKKPSSLTSMQRWLRRRRRRGRVRVRACSRAIRGRLKAVLPGGVVSAIQDAEARVRAALRMGPPPSAAGKPRETVPPNGWVQLPSWTLFLFHQARVLAYESRERGADTIVSFLPFTNAIAILAKLRYRRDLRVVINVHSNKSRLLKTLGSHERFFIGTLMRLLYRRADRVIAVSGGIRDDLAANYGVPAQRIEVVPNPVAVERIRARASEVVTDCFSNTDHTLVAVGRLVRLKAYDRLIEAVGTLDDLSIRLLVIGDGPERAALEKQAAAAGIAERVHFMGYQENPWKFMRTADALVLSSDVEGLPNVIGEALALDLPVVATDCCRGVSEYLGDSEFGLVVPPGETAALADGIRTILTEPAVRDRYRERAAARIAAFDIDPVVTHFERVVLGGAGR